jgi:tellurite resistance protein TerC
MNPLWWVLAGGLVVVLLALDLLVFHRHASVDTTRRALMWSVLWVGVGLLFSIVVGLARGWVASAEYLTAFLVEKALSVDNLFVFIAIFAYFAVRPEYHHRVLFWGILGAIVTRGLFIFGGVALLHKFHWVLYVLGGLLIVTGIRLLWVGDEVHPERNRVVRLTSQVLPVQRAYAGERFLVRTDAGWRFTPLLLVLVAIESTDIMFAVDSVPAVLAVSQDPFVVYTSNIFAILGLRALYFVLAGALKTLRFLKPALVTILVLVGVKMLITDLLKVPILASLLAIALILAVATVASLLYPGKPEDGTEKAGGPAD